MDVLKFLDLLQSESLCLARADTLGSEFEGTLPKANMAEIENAYYEYVKNTPNPLIKLEDMADAKRIYDENNTFLMNSVYANGWHCCEYENALMWRRYGASGLTVAIQSTYAKLRDGLADKTAKNRTPKIGMVSYRDYFGPEKIGDEGNVLTKFMHAPRELADEREVRIMGIQWGTGGPEIINIPFSLSSIDTVRMNPGAPAWQRHKLTELSHDYGFDLLIMPSDMDTNLSFGKNARISASGSSGVPTGTARIRVEKP